ncbi:host specificity protein J [Cognatishimia sp. MH4019]|uniref:host specificity protein J n=1 Tax=Cognatishimia sp. MH4019 TaxID=2854030 RepID=UPI001CD420C2|nr:phage tail protein [Cognatishimia sp. MH4019]
MVSALRGAKGGGKGGGSKQRTPKEDPDNLLVESTAYVIDVLSEGPIEGFADERYPAKCIYFDDTPLQNANGTYNFSGVKYWLRTGTPSQDHVPGFAAVENEIGVGALVEHGQPVARAVMSQDVDAVRIKVGVNQLSTLNKKNGDLKGARVEFDIEMQVSNGGWRRVGSRKRLSGKTTSGYQRDYRINLPSVRPVSLRVKRVTRDRDESNVQDDLFFVSYTEVIDAKLQYPDTAYVALAIPAQAFGGRVPRRSYRIKGVQCWVPTNYNPEARTYDESAIWDGTFKLAYSNNPSFFLYTIFLENRWGLGERIAPELVDKWRIYQIGKYCDQLVPDGLGGSEPRFTINGVMNTREAAYQVITQLSTVFRGVTYWGAGAVVPVQDAPADPVKLVTNANVVDGAFNYAGTGLNARKTAVVASFRDVADHYKLKAGVVFEDHDAIQRYNRRQSDISLPFTTSRGEALRAAKWLVDTDTTQRETVNYQAGYDHAALRPGDRILISDKHRVGFRMGGRVLSIAEDRLSLTVDDPVALQASETYRLLLADSVGDFVEADLQAGQDGSQTVLLFDAPVPDGVSAGTVFIVTASNLAPRQFRVLSNTPEKHLYSIIALEDDPNKYDRIEQGITVDDAAPYILPSVQRPSPVVGLSVDVSYRAEPAGLVASVSWQVAPGETVAAFQVDFTDEAETRTVLGEQSGQSIDVPLTGDSFGPFTVHVRVRNALFTWSEWSDLTFYVPEGVITPGDVTGFRMRVLGDQAHLTWDRGEPVVSHYHIRHAADPASGWANAVDVMVDAIGRDAMVPALSGAYFIRAVSVFDRKSANAVMVTSNTVNLAHFNVVEAVSAEPQFEGSRGAGLVRSGDVLALLASNSIFSGQSIYSGQRIFAGDAVPAAAYYQMEDIVDLGDVFTSRLSADLRGYGYRLNDSVFSGQSIFSGASVWGGVDGLWRLSVEVSTAQTAKDDPAIVWSDWSPLIVGDYLARSYRFRVLFEAFEPRVSVVLEQLALQVDMPDRIERGDDIACPAAGVQVTFSPPFLAKPAIVVDGQELPTGARSVRTNADRFGFFQQFFDANDNPIPAVIDFTAAGYGRGSA